MGGEEGGTEEGRVKRWVGEKEGQRKGGWEDGRNERGREGGESTNSLFLLEEFLS